MEFIAMAILFFVITVFGFAGAFLLVNNFFQGPVVIPASFEFEPIILTFFVILVVIILLERLLEVFVAVTRERKCTELECLNTIKSDTLKDIKSDDPNFQKAKDEVATSKLNLVKFKARTRQIVGVIGLLFGISIGIIGVRFLQVFIDVSYAPKPQITAFYTIDAILTGSLLAAGSRFIHQLNHRIGDVIIRKDAK
jgi:hypothetical protein